MMHVFEHVTIKQVALTIALVDCLLDALRHTRTLCSSVVTNTDLRAVRSDQLGP
jgi:hypothetical protein